jgi:hypothetical protein
VQRQLDLMLEHLGLPPVTESEIDAGLADDPSATRLRQIIDRRQAQGSSRQP